MIHKLLNIVNIRTGVYTKNTNGHGDAYYLQVNNFDKDGQLELNQELFKDVILGEILDIHLLKQDSILFASKGGRYFAYTYKTEHIAPAVAASVFFVLSIKEDYQYKIKADYITWFLNNDNTITWLKSKAKGSSVPSISKVDLGDINIPVPSWESQEKILNMNQLALKEQNLIRSLSIQKNIYYQHLLNNLANK